MAKGKLYGYDSSGSDSSDDDDVDLEFPNPDAAADEFSTAHRRKRRRTGRDSKESAALGVFGSESEDERPTGRGAGRRSGTRLREKTVGFVKQGELVEEDDDDDNDDTTYPENTFAGLREGRALGTATATAAEDWDISDERPRLGGGGRTFAPKASPPTMLARSEDWDDGEPEARPRLGLGGRGFTKASEENSGTSTPASIDAHIGLGFQTAPSAAFGTPLGRGFVSSSSASVNYVPFAPAASSEAPQVVRPSFTQVQQPRRGDRGAPTASAVNPDSFAARMMAKMGYQAGQGLGKSGAGILNPIEVKMRPQGVGVGAVREMTPAARAEAKRARRLRGEAVSDSEEEAEKKRRAKQRGSAGNTPGGTPLRAKKKEKTTFRTADEISASAKGLEVPSALKSIVDYTGKETRFLTSASGVMARDPSVEGESMKIAKRARRDLESFAGEWKGLEDQKAYIEKEEKRLSAELEEQTEEIKRLQGMVEVVNSLQSLTLVRTSDSIEGVVSMLETLQLEYKNEIDDHDLSEVAVGALHPLVSSLLHTLPHTHIQLRSPLSQFRQELASWSPLSDPFRFFEYFSRLRTILHIRTREDAESEYARNGFIAKPKYTTHYESMLLSVWLPKVRSSINNDWDVHKPASVLSLLDAWSSLLPPFIHANILTQLILPKLRAGVSDWNPRSGKRRRSRPPPHTWVFQWLPHLGSHMEELLRDVRRKFGVVLDSWDLSQGSIDGLSAWAPVFGPDELEKLLIRHLLPRLALQLRTDFDVNPADQQLASLESVLVWLPLFRVSTAAHLLVAEFFPKWTNVLHQWLTANPDFSEVQQWYTFWQDVFPPQLRNAPAVRAGFVAGLDMMNRALDLGADAHRLAPPPAGPTRPAKPVPVLLRAVPVERPPEATFRDAVEDWAAEQNLLLVPLRKAHEATGAPLFRITASASGVGGVVVYFSGDVVWAQDRKNREVWVPMGLEDVLARVEGK